VLPIGCADDINVMGRMKRAVSEVCEELKGRTKEVMLNIRAEKNICMKRRYLRTRLLRVIVNAAKQLVY
jgi:hypothetical protein